MRSRGGFNSSPTRGRNHDDADKAGLHQPTSSWPNWNCAGGSLPTTPFKPLGDGGVKDSPSRSWRHRRNWLGARLEAHPDRTRARLQNVEKLADLFDHESAEVTAGLEQIAARHEHRVVGRESLPHAGKLLQMRR